MSEFRFSPRPNRAREIAWREWGNEAFTEARLAQRPVLLAISAVWCHWCHVMDETTYSDPAVISTINDRYVPVRVDNDRRPDVNRRYNMGGWPTTAFLTPDGEIITGGTYIPPDVMRQYLGQVAELYRDRRGEIDQRVAELRLAEAQRQRTVAGPLARSIVDDVVAQVRALYDPEFGGFGREPKFPQPQLLRLLLDEYRRVRSDELAEMLHRTLGAMASGGMHDAVEGGFFRYATQRNWDVPHYEKMLEDNAELLAVYAQSERVFPGSGYDGVVRDVVGWMDAVLWREDVSLFGGSQDADEHYYTLERDGRQRHGAPYVDPTIYTGWNALAGSAYLRAGEALDDPAIGERGRAVGRELDRRMRDASGALLHFDDGGGPKIPDLLGDLAAYLALLLDAYEAAVGHPEHFALPLERAVEIARRMRERLEDPQGGFYDAPERTESGRVARRDRPIEENALAAEGLLRLADLTGDAGWRDAALRALRAFAGEYHQWGQFAASYARVVARALAEPLVITVVGPAGDAAAEALWKIARASLDPARALHRLVPRVEDERLERLGFPGDRVAAYVCVGTTCSAPLADAPGLERELARARERSAASVG